MIDAVYVRRTLESTVSQVAGQYPALMLIGPRQVGKTTLLRHLAGEQRDYVTLDDPGTLELAKNDPKLFFSDSNRRC